MKLKINKYVLLLVIIQAVVYYQWVFTNNIFSFGDVGIYSSLTQSFLFEQVWSIYSSHAGFGALDIAASNYPYLFLFGLLGKLGVNFVRSSKILLFWPIVFGVVLNSFFFVRFFSKDNFSAFMSALFYGYGFYFLISLTGALYLSFAYAYAPLLLLSFFKFIKSPNIKNSIFFGLISSFFGFVEFRALYILLVICILYFIYFLISEKISLKKKLYCCLMFGFSGLIVLGLNLFWLLPVGLQGQVIDNNLFNRGLFGDEYFTLVNAFSIMHPWWNWGEPTIFERQDAPFFLLIIPLLFVLSLLKKDKENSKILLFFSMLFLLGVLLTKQSAEPFSGFYFWMYNNFPGFNAFREASKFFIVSALSFSVLFGLFFSKFQKKMWLKMLLLLSFSCLILSNVYIIFSGKLETMFIPRKMETDFVRVNAIFNTDLDFYRVLWLPHSSKFSDYNDKHPQISMLYQYNSVYKDLITSNIVSLENSIQDIISDPGFIDVIRKQSIKYIIVPRDLIWDDIESPWKNPNLYTKILDKKEGLKKVFDFNGNFVYQVDGYFPRLLLENGSLVFKNTSINEFSLSLTGLSEKHVLVFSDLFNSGWKLYLEPRQIKTNICPSIKDFSLTGSTGHFYNASECKAQNDMDILKGIGRFFELSIFDNTHHLVNDYANGRILDADYIKQNFSKEYYEENPDGSVNINLSLYFYPQSWFYLGGGVGGLIVIILLGLYIVNKIEK